MPNGKKKIANGKLHRNSNKVRLRYVLNLCIYFFFLSIWFVLNEIEF